MIGLRALRLDVVSVLRCAVSLGALILAAPGVSTAVPTVDGIQVRPSPFSPNGDGFRDSTELFFTPNAETDSVSVTVSVFRDAGSQFLAELVSNVSFLAGVTVQVLWEPGILSDGLYRFEIEVTEGSTTVNVPAFVEADTSAPSVFFTMIQPNPYDPASAPPDDVLAIFFTVTTTDSSTLTDLIVRQGTVVEDSLGSAADGGLHQLTWDGNRTSGTPVPSGIYEVFAEARDLAGNSGTASQTFTVDRDPPEFVVESDTLQTTSFPFTVRGLAADDDRVVNVLVQFDPDSAFVAVDSLGAPADTVGYNVVIAPPDTTAGILHFTLRAIDDVGHETDQEFVLGFGPVLPVALSSVLVDGNGPYREHDVVRIRTQWNLDDLTVTGNFSDLDSRWTPGEEDVVNEGGGFYLVTYELSRSNVRPPGDRLVRIRGSTGTLATTDTVTVALAAGATEPDFSVDRNLLDPHVGDAVTIEAPEETDLLEVEIFNLTGARIQHLQGTGGVVWDGRTEEGGIAASGTYFLRLQSGSLEEVRRLVVRKGE